MSFTPCGCFDIGLSERIKFYVWRKQRRTTVSSDDSMFDWLDRKKKKANERAPSSSTLHNSSTIANGSLKISHAQSPSIEKSVKFEDNSTLELQIRQKADLTPLPDQKKESPVDSALSDDDSAEAVVQNGDCTNSEDNPAKSNIKEPAVSEPQSDEDSDSPVSNLLSSIGGDVDDVFQMAKRTISSFEDEASEFAKRFTGWGKKDEPEVEITEITEIPADFDMTQEAIAEGECYRITLEIIKANDLAAMDSNGLSDPFVEIVLHKDLVLKTKTINKTINPVWNEKFTLYIDDRSALANIQIYDYDIFGANDRIGYIDLDLASTPLFHRYTTTLNIGSSVEGEDFVGTLTFSYLVEVVPTSLATEVKSIGTRGQERLLGIIQITVIEGMDLPPMNSDGTCDPFIRLQLGDQQHETKVIPSTLNPKWRESFEFRYLNTSGNTIQASLWDSEVGLSDNIIGDTEIDISQIAPNKPFKYIFGLDHTNTKINLLIKVLKFAELGAAELQLQKEINDAEVRILSDQYALANTAKDIANVGYLIVKLIRATNLPSKKIGSMDPYVVMEIENCRSVSPVRENCLEPEWNLTYRFPINDYHSVLYLSLLDEEDLVNDDVLGRIAIPLFNCKGLKKYILKDPKLTGVGKGELIVETAVFYNAIRAAVRTFSPKEEIILKDPAKFDISLLQRDVKRITAQLEMVQDLGEGLDQIIRWRSKPLSFVSMIIFVLVTYYIELWMVPLALGLVLLYTHIAQRCGLKRRETWVKNNANKAYYELSRETEGESKSFGAKLDKMKAVFTTAEGIQKGLDFAASVGEKFGHIGQWKVSFVSTMCCCILLLASLLLYYVSLRYIIIVWGLNKFQKFYFRPNLVDNNELVDLLSRIPSFPEIEQYRQIRTRGTRRHREPTDHSSVKAE